MWLRCLPWFLFCACASMDASKGGGDTAISAGAAIDEGLALDLWTELSGYEGWAQHEDWTGVVPSEDGTHGTHVQIWFNDSAGAPLNGEGSAPMPDGAILVKEGYDNADGSPVNGVTAMKKIDGYDPDNGDWFWASYEPDGAIKTSGSVAFCIGCHAPGQDGVRFVTW